MAKNLLILSLLVLTGCGMVNNVGVRASPDYVCMTFPTPNRIPPTPSSDDDQKMIDWMKPGGK